MNKNRVTKLSPMETGNQRLTLDQPVIYEIKVPGKLDVNWSEWVGPMITNVEHDDLGSPVTTLTGTFDQAGLHGFLRRLYALGIPLISVVCLDFVCDA